MSDTHMFEVTGVSGTKLHAVLSIVHPDESFLWVSPAAIASLVQQSAASWSSDKDEDESHEEAANEAASALSDAGLDDDCGVSSAESLARLNDKAKAFIASVKVGAVKNGKVVGRNDGVAIFVERIPGSSEDPLVELEITATKPEYVSYLTEGFRMKTALVSFGPNPTRTA